MAVSFAVGKIDTMKKLLLMLLMLLPLIGVGQNPWPAADSEWNFIYDWGWPPPSGNYMRQYVNGTDNIQGKECTRIFQDVVNFNTYIQGTEPAQYWHFDGDTLWHLIENDSSFYPLICFNALPGDTWHPLPFDSASFDTACTVLPIEVVDTFTVYYDGLPYRGLTLADQQENGHLRWSGMFNERTYKDPQHINNGYSYTLINSGYPFPSYNVCGDIAVDWNWNALLCYQDMELGLVAQNISSYQGQTNCDYPWNEVSVRESVSVGRLLLYPNPTTSPMGIQLPDNNLNAIQTSLYDISGRLAHQQPFNPNMDMGYLDRGTYVVVVETEEGNFRGTIQKE